MSEIQQLNTIAKLQAIIVHNPNVSMATLANGYYYPNRGTHRIELPERLTLVAKRLAPKIEKELYKL